MAEAIINPDISNRESPLVTVLIPTYNSEAYIKDCLDSIMHQTFQDFEVLIVNEYGSNDHTVSIAGSYGDKRIRIIQNTKKLGLAESLNVGLREAEGKYAARMDADDMSHPGRLELEVEFMESHPEYGVCGSWQHHFGEGIDLVHRCLTSHEDIQAELIFHCDMCHSTLMLRREFFLSNHLFYRSGYAAEDYDLWTRAVRKFKFANLPIVLGEYRVSSENATAQKLEALIRESSQMTARNIKDYFGIVLDEQMTRLQCGWRNEFVYLSKRERKVYLKKEQKLLQDIWNINLQKNVLDQNGLLKALNKKWRCVTNTWSQDGKIYPLEELFTIFSYVETERLPVRVFKKLFRGPYHWFKGVTAGAKDGRM